MITTNRESRPSISLLYLSKSVLFRITCLVLALFPIQSCIANEANPPNLLFILTDQHRQDGVGAYGLTEVKTPNLDRFAKEGIRFNRAYTAQPVCSPNRAAIMSGLYPHNNSVRENTWDMDSSVRILPDLLREHGYRTGYFGKWHLGDPARDAWEEMPIYPNDGRGSGHYYEVDGKKVYQTEVITSDVINFMTADKGNSFCVFASYYPPHPPYSVPESYEAMYSEIYPDDEARRKYYAMCTAVDDAVGVLLNSLEEQGVAENTLIVFTTEHGHYFEHRWNDHAKRLCYDLTARIPMLMRFPGTIPEGQVSNALISSVDLFPTMVNLLKLPAVEGLDGVNLGNQITKRTDKGRASLVIVNVPYINKSNRPHQPELDKGDERCVVKGDWKLILSTVREPELYHLPSDSSETNNRWTESKDSESVSQLKAALAAWGKRTRDSLTPKLLSEL
jgi:arylsulfatase A-like enzyme